jgi:signal transduction histidine kinase
LGAVRDGWQKPLEILTGKAWELNRIVDDLLQASRIEANALLRNLSEMDLRTVVRDASDRARPRADLLGAEIATGMTNDPLSVEADGKQIGRILDNLINNGLTYCVRPPRLSINVSGEGGRAIVRVEDNGVGIPEDEKERVFERFHRTNEPAFHNVPGTGLGLYISRQLAEGHGGSLVIESSTPERGTVFALSLPIAVATSAPIRTVGIDSSEASTQLVAPIEGLTLPARRRPG